MGKITVTISGSFTKTGVATLSATEGGHAMAIQRAIGYLLAELPAAICKDHILHDKSQHPNPDFGEVVVKMPGVCEHGKGLSEYCEPCGRINGGPG